jgi:uncharacterized protein YidB (DUF937 family)
MSNSNPNAGENEKLTSALNEIFSNPQMLSAISSMAQNLKNGNASTPITNEKSNEKSNEISNEKSKENNEENSEAPQGQISASISDKLPELLNMLSPNGSKIKQNRQSELLCALKPYLSQNRNDAIDKIIRFSELSSVFKNLS